MAGGAGQAVAAAPAGPDAGRNLPARRHTLYGRLPVRRLERAPVARHAPHSPHGDGGLWPTGFHRPRLCAWRVVGETGYRSPTPLFARTITSGNRRVGKACVSSYISR